MMCRSLWIPVVATVVLCGAWGQTVGTGAVPAVDDAAQTAVVRLGGQLMVAGKAYEYDRVLADEIGPRLTGSANYTKAAGWASDEFKRLGLANVHHESWEIAAAWEPETGATASILKPHEQRLHMESDGWSPSTPAGGVRGTVYYLKAFTPDAIHAATAQIKDSIVLIDSESLQAGDPLLWGKLSDEVAEIAGAGARGILLGVGGTNDVPSMIGLFCCNGNIAPLPVGNVGLEDTQLLRRMLDRGPVEVEFSFKNRIHEHAPVDNVVAELPGTDANAGYVLVGGHLDSWHMGTGAEDNGTGAASVLAVAQAFKASGIQPRRTIRFVLFGGEEQGLLGSIHYARVHAAEMDQCVAVVITDTGSEPPLGWFVYHREDEKQALAPLKPLLDALGAGGTSDNGEMTFDTDNGPFMPYGVPAYVLWTGLSKYWDLHHKPSDTFDKVNQRDLNLGAAVVGMTVLEIANMPQPPKHLTATEVDEQLKQLKQNDQYEDLKTHKVF